MGDNIILSSLGYIGMIALGIGIGSSMISRHPDLDTAQIFRNENGKTIIRTYERWIEDQILVQKGKDDSVYVSLGEYLNDEKFAGYNRMIEEAKIKKLVRW